MGWMVKFALCVFIMGTALGMPSTRQDHGQSDTAGKRSQEDIMFGNQQNKPAGMMDDLIVFPDRKSSRSASMGRSTQEKNFTEESSAQSPRTESLSHEAASDIATKDTERELPGVEGNIERRTAGRFDYYDYLDGSNAASNREAPVQQQEPTGALDYSMYDYSDGLFRRKRTLRNSLDELLSSRRLHRRALRYKRDTNMDALLYFLTEIAKSDPKYASLLDREQTPAFEVSSTESDEGQLEQYLSELSDMTREGRARTLATLAAAAALADSDSYPASRSSVTDDFRDRVPGWFEVTRRSQAPFYPQDYRYLVMPSTTEKRSRGDRWGRILQKRQQQSQKDTADISRLYALAGLLAEPDQEGTWHET